MASNPNQEEFTKPIANAPTYEEAMQCSPVPPGQLYPYPMLNNTMQPMAVPPPHLMQQVHQPVQPIPSMQQPQSMPQMMQSKLILR